MDNRPVALDFFSCQGAASKGLNDAGFRVIGSDLFAQPRYPYEFVQGDALEIFDDMVRKYRPAIVGGSPPCQGYSDCQRIQGNDHPALIAPFRELCLSTGLPYWIENVEGARPEMKDPITLCGAMFPGLNTYRHRLFESNVPLTAPGHPEHQHLTVKMGRPLREGDWYHAVGNFSNVPYVKRNMGVEWMTRDGVRECIPPAYAGHIGRQFMALVS